MLLLRDVAARASSFVPAVVLMADLRFQVAGGRHIAALAPAVLLD
jgi:hypothetical protein